MICTMPGCGRPVKAWGLCQPHYLRAWRAGATPKRKRAKDLFWAKINRSGPVPEYRPALGRCWLWTSYKDGHGYGALKIDGQMVSAHRYMYELLVGPIPDGLQIDHLCRVRGCVNPAHMEIVTGRENALRGFSPWASNARKIYCKRGHLFDAVDHRGNRMCRTCRRAADRRRDRSRRDAG